ncbi:MAG: MauE/DoxX family redox-associated membrane protein [Chloroflexota bacterium]
MLDLALILVWTLALVFLFAGLGKLTSLRSSTDVLISSGEVALALLLLIAPWHQLLAFVTFCVCVGYMFHAFAAPREETCQCFGRRLPTTGVNGQRVRNIVLLLFATCYTVVASVRPDYWLPEEGIDAVIGLLTGVTIVAGPWAFRWALGPAGQLF